MQYRSKAALALIGALLVAGCDKSSFRTSPVVLKTANGDVTCQLYQHDRVMWDEAITHPEKMTKEDADALCFEEGERVKNSL